MQQYYATDKIKALILDPNVEASACIISRKISPTMTALNTGQSHKTLTLSMLYHAQQL